MWSLINLAANCECRKQNKSTSSVPPVIALSMKQGLGVTVQGLDRVGLVVALFCFIKGYKESRLLDGIQGLLVLTNLEVGVTSIGPRGPAECQTKADLRQSPAAVTPWSLLGVRTAWYAGGRCGTAGISPTYFLVIVTLKLFLLSKTVLYVNNL